MNEIKDSECIEIKSPEDDFNNFVIVRYDWPCNIEKITETVSQFRKEKAVCIIGAPRKEYINWWEDDTEYDKYFAFMELFDFCCTHMINDSLLEDLKEACVLSTEGYTPSGIKAWLSLKDEKSVCFFNMITAEGKSFSDITTSVVNNIKAAKDSNKKYRIDKIITTVISNTDDISLDEIEDFHSRINEECGNEVEMILSGTGLSEKLEYKIILLAM